MYDVGAPEHLPAAEFIDRGGLIYAAFPPAYWLAMLAEILRLAEERSRIRRELEAWSRGESPVREETFADALDRICPEEG